MALGERLPFRVDGSVGGARVGADRPTLSDLAALIVRPAWHGDALCKEYPQINFIPGKGQTGGAAKAICARCAVSFECRRAGIDGDEVGVWGGLDSHDRRALRAETRQGGRPPQEPAA